MYRVRHQEGAKEMNLKKLAIENKPSVFRTILIFALILLAAALRLAPHPWNFTPVGAIAIFAGATVRDRRLAFLFPLLVMFATDAINSFNVLSPMVYASFLLSVLISRYVVGASFSASNVGAGLQPGQQAQRASECQTESATNAKKHAVPRIAAATFLGALQFFLVTNFGVWAFLNSYPRTGAGLAACYLAGLPLFWNTLAGDATYATLLFGAFALAERLAPQLRQSVVAGL
jgi:hypothetical protein